MSKTTEKPAGQRVSEAFHAFDEALASAVRGASKKMAAFGQSASRARAEELDED